jgi:hypothetical protein
MIHFSIASLPLFSYGNSTLNGLQFVQGSRWGGRLALRDRES